MRFPLTIVAAIVLGALPYVHAAPDGPGGKPNVVAVNTKELEAFSYDAGLIKFVATTAQTHGRCAVMEMTEMPGYKTGWHQHNDS